MISFLLFVLNYATKVTLFFYMQIKNNVFLIFASIYRKLPYNPNIFVVLLPGWLAYCPLNSCMSLGFSSSPRFMSATEPSLSPFSSLARPRSW